MTCWTLQDHAAQLASGPFSATLDLMRPDRGLGSWRVDGQPLAAPLDCALGVDWQAGLVAPADVFIRGDDLVARYEETSARPLRVELYWRRVASSDPRGVAIDLQVSVNTSLLDADPRLATVSHLRRAELARLDDTQAVWTSVPDPLGEPRQGDRADGFRCLLAERGGLDFAYAEMVHPQDDEGSELRSAGDGTEGGLVLRHALFVDSLEKGVILRARIRGLIVARAEARARTASEFAALVAAPLPLTT